MNKNVVMTLGALGVGIVILVAVLVMGYINRTPSQPYKGPRAYDGTQPPTIYEGIIIGVDTSKSPVKERWNVKFTGQEWKAQTFYHRQFAVGETVYVEIIKTPTDGVIYEDAYLLDLELGNFLVQRGEAKHEHPEN